MKVRTANKITVVRIALELSGGVAWVLGGGAGGEVGVAWGVTLELDGVVVEGIVEEPTTEIYIHISTIFKM